MENSRQTALITGASRGIGFSIARSLGREDIRLLLVARDADQLRQAQATLLEEGIHADVFAADVSEEAGVSALKQSIAGPVDIVVNNAGFALSSPFAKTDLDSWNRVIQSNLTSTYLCMQAFLPDMVRQNYGRIVNVASIAGKIGFQYTSAYCAAKHAVLGLTKSVALEVARKGVTVNAVCPGWVDTPMTEETIRNIVLKTGRAVEEARRFLDEQSPLHRLISPEEVASTVRFLISPAASGINGQAINVCGGQIFS